MMTIYKDIIFEGERVNFKMKTTKKYKIKIGSAEKEFVTRNSLLTDLFENNVHIRTVYSFSITIFLGFFVSTVVSDYTKNEDKLLRALKKTFGKLDTALLLWTCYFAGTCLNYVCFCIWARGRTLFPKLNQLYFWDRFWSTALASYYIFSFQSSAHLVTLFKLPTGSSAFILIDQVRLLMKIHSFVRNTAPKIIQHKFHSESKLTLPKFSHFVYYTFAPTLIYSDVYPRTEKIRWSFVFFRVLELVGAFLMFALAFERLFLPPVSEIGLRMYTKSEIVLAIFENTFTGTVVILGVFFLLLHSWHNLFAELLRFGDRFFYNDWWNAYEFSHYMRRWNSIVQDWLYFYVYLDLYENVLKNNKLLPKVCVFIVSAAVHEFVIVYTFGFCCPVLFIAYLLLSPLILLVHHPPVQIFNVIFLYASSIYLGMTLVLYALEYNVRLNRPEENSTWADFFIPKFLNYVK